MAEVEARLATLEGSIKHLDKSTTLLQKSIDKVDLQLERLNNSLPHTYVPRHEHDQLVKSLDEKWDARLKTLEENIKLLHQLRKTDNSNLKDWVKAALPAIGVAVMVIVLEVVERGLI